MEGEVRKAATSPPPDLHTPIQGYKIAMFSFSFSAQLTSAPLLSPPLTSKFYGYGATNYSQIWSCLNSPALPSLPSAYPLLKHTLRTALKNHCAFKLKKKMISSTVRKVTIPSTSVCYIFPYGPTQVHIR